MEDSSHVTVGRQRKGSTGTWSCQIAGAGASFDKTMDPCRHVRSPSPHGESKQEKFLEGLNDDLGLQLTVATFNNYQELVDKALILEGRQQQVENRKRKYGHGKYNSGV